MLEKLVQMAEKDAEVLAVIAFGSFARGERHSDIDVCLVLKEKKANLDTSRKRLDYLSEFPDLDIHVFQQLPLHIRARILKEGKVLFCRDKNILYDIFYKTIKDFVYFEPKYRIYLGVDNG